MKYKISNGVNKYVIGIIGFLALMLLLVFTNPTQQQQPEENKLVDSVLEATPSTYDFGEIDIFGGKVTTTYTITNTGVEAVTITAAETSCMCTEGLIGALSFGMHGSSGGTVVIQGGASEVLTAVFDPLAHGPEGTGKIKRELHLRTNSSTVPEVEVTFSGDVIKK